MLVRFPRQMFSGKRGQLRVCQVVYEPLSSA